MQVGQTAMEYKQRGDTLVEVLMSIVILSMVIVGAITLMSKGLQAEQVALEHSETRQEVNSQLEYLKYLRNQYTVNSSSSDAQTWLTIISNSNSTQTDYSGCSVTSEKAGTAFYLNNSSGSVEYMDFDASSQPETYATAGSGLWIEATVSTGVTPAYVDFVVRACWEATGGVEQQTVTAERLYDSSR